MRGKSSSPERREVVWHQARIWWPVECVPVTLEIAHPRKLTALEWAVLRVMDAFREAPPSLTEVAYQLGIDDPSFLADAVKEAVRLRALAPRQEGTVPRDLPDLDFTSMGYELFKRGQIEAEPAEHGETFYFDALTDEARTEPRQAVEYADPPFPGSQPEPQPRESVGLDRARALVRQFHADLLRGDGEVRSVEPQEHTWPRLVWQSVELNLRVDREGGLDVEARGLTPQARAFLMAADLVEEGVVPKTAISEDWSSVGQPRCSSQLSYADWRSLTARDLPVKAVSLEITRLLKQAREEIVLHAAWLAVPEVSEQLPKLVERGRRVFVVGAGATRCFAFMERPQVGIGLEIRVDVPAPGALVVDGRGGVLLDDVFLSVGERRIAIELAGALNQEGAKQCRKKLLDAAAAAIQPPPKRLLRPLTLQTSGSPQGLADAALRDEHLQIALGHLAIRPDEATFSAAASHATCLSQGLERVALLARIAGVGKALAPDLKEEALRGPAVAAWRAAVELLRGSVDGGDVSQQLARLAPDGVEAHELVGAALQSWGNGGRAHPGEEGQRLLTLQSAVDARWGKGAASRCEPWRAARDALLDPGRWTLETLDEVVSLAGQLLDAQARVSWAEGVIASISEPASLNELHRWLAGMEPLAEVAPDALQRATAQIWTSLVEAYPEHRRDLVHAAHGVLPADVVAEAICGDVASLEALNEVRRLMGGAGFQEVSADWRERAEALLPDPTGFHDPDRIRQVVAQLSALSAESPIFAEVGRSWAARMADQIPVVREPEGLSWWLGELAPLRPLLDKLEQRATQGVRRFRGQLGSAKVKGDTLWSACLRSWTDLGLPAAALEALVDDGGGKAPDRSDKGKKGKKRRRR